MHFYFDRIESPALTKRELAELLLEQLGLSKREAKDFWKIFLIDLPVN
jgi:nucleoid DNA-binding protein